MVLGRSSSVGQMERVALQYPSKAKLEESIVQDFHSFRQALNVASADQRVLMLINASPEQQTDLRQSLRAVTNDERIVGRFHVDFDHENAWKESIAGTNDRPGIVLIHPGEFGLSGKVIKQLPLDATNEVIVAEMLQANKRFAATTPKKEYSQHVAKGRSKGIYFEGAVPYGEDRDGDGEIDRGRGGRGGGGGSRRR